jgi:class 3 adenylate cyclase
VNLAARIAAHAGPGRVLVSDQVVAEARTGAVAFQPLGPVRLKGVTGAVPLHEAVRAVARSGT